MVTRRAARSILILTMSAILLFTMSFTGSVSAATPRDPVLLVHGWGMNSPTTWTAMKAHLEADGYRVYMIDFTSNIASNVTEAQELRAKVDSILARTGASKLDIVTHSMGGLSTRYYIKYLGGSAKVRDVIEIGTPNHGTSVALVAFGISEGAREMLPNSAFLTDLNRADETPNPVKWTTVLSLYDEANVPKFNCMLNGARNLLVWWPVGHLGLVLDLQTYYWVVEGLNGAGWNIS